MPNKNFVEINNKVGKIVAPEGFLDNWNEIREKELIDTFLMFRNFQSNENIAWGLAVNEKINSWRGSLTLL